MWFPTRLKFIFNTHSKERCNNSFNALFYAPTLKTLENFNSVDDNRYDFLLQSVFFFPTYCPKIKRDRTCSAWLHGRARECFLALFRLHQLVQKCSCLQPGAGTGPAFHHLQHTTPHITTENSIWILKYCKWSFPGFLIWLGIFKAYLHLWSVIWKHQIESFVLFCTT